MAEMLTVLPPDSQRSGERLRRPPVCVETRPPVFIEYTPEYKREHGISNEIDRNPGGLERSPEQDDFESNEIMLGDYAQLKAFKTPSATEVIAAVTVAKEVLNVLTEAVRSGRNLYESVMDWINSDKNRNMTDSQKVQALQLANVMAKQMDPEKAQKTLNIAA